MKQIKAENLPAEGFVRQNQIIPHIIPVSPATFWRMVKKGEFPPPVKLTHRITAWPVGDVREWLNGMSER